MDKLLYGIFAIGVLLGAIFFYRMHTREVVNREIFPNSFKIFGYIIVVIMIMLFVVIMLKIITLL